MLTHLTGGCVRVCQSPAGRFRPRRQPQRVVSVPHLSIEDVTPRGLPSPAKTVNSTAVNGGRGKDKRKRGIQIGGEGGRGRTDGSASQAHRKIGTGR